MSAEQIFDCRIFSDHSNLEHSLDRFGMKIDASFGFPVLKSTLSVKSFYINFTKMFLRI